MLGQEQDEIGRNFSAGEAFNGRISQFNLWQHVLPESELVELASYRCVQTAGNVIAWSDFEHLPNDEVKKERQFCSGSDFIPVKLKPSSNEKRSTVNPFKFFYYRSFYYCDP